MYQFFLGGTLLPVTPENLTIKINNQNKKISLINEGEINILKDAGLTEVSFSALLPAVEYAFTQYEGSYRNPSHFLNKLESLKTSKEPFRFVVVRDMPDGTQMHGTNMEVSLEDYEITESADDGSDITVSINLLQYREYGLTEVAVITETAVAPAAVREQENAPTPAQDTTYTVVKGDTLCKIAKRFYGNSNQWRAIYEANKSVIGGNPDLIYPGQVLTIPNASSAKTTTAAATTTASAKTAANPAPTTPESRGKHKFSVSVTGQSTSGSHFKYTSGGKEYTTKLVSGVKSYVVMADADTTAWVSAQGKTIRSVRIVPGAGNWKKLGSSAYYAPVESDISISITFS